MEITRCTSEKGKEHNPIELELQASGDHSAGARFLFFSSGAGFYPSEQDKEYQYTTTISLDDVFQILLAIQKRLDSIPRNEMDSIPRNEMDSIPRNEMDSIPRNEKVSSAKAEQELLDQFAETNMATLLLKTVNSYIKAVNQTREFSGEIRYEEDTIFLLDF